MLHKYFKAKQNSNFQPIVSLVETEIAEKFWANSLTLYNLFVI